MSEGSISHLNQKIIFLVWSLFLFLALIYMINLLQITYYPIVHRANVEGTIHIVLISDQLDSALIYIFAALSSFFTFLAFQRFSGNKWLASSSLIILNLSALLTIYGSFDLALVLIVVGVSSYIILAVIALRQIINIMEALLVILCFLEASSLFHWLLLPLMMPSGYVDFFSRFSAIEAQLFYAPADLTPLVMLILLFSFPLFTVINWLRRGSAKSKKDDVALSRFNLGIDSRILLVIAIILTALISSYPYLPSINPTGKYVGTDIYYYTLWLNEMEINPKQAIEFAIHDPSSRPLFLLFLYYIKLSIQVPTIAFLEWIAIPIFCLLPVSVYLFVSISNGRAFAGLAALLSSFSINVVVGIYTAYYSNMLALSLQYLALTLLLLALRKMSYSVALLSSALSILTIFIHPWTWAFILVTICLLVGTRLLFIGMSHDEMCVKIYRQGPILIYITTNIAAELLRSFVFNVSSATWISYRYVGAGIGLEEIFNLLLNLNFTFKFFAGGFFNNFWVLLSAIIGIRWLMEQKEPTKDILITWLSIAALPTLFINFGYNNRIFYNLPIQVFSTIGLYFVLSKVRSRRVLLWMVFLIFIFYNINYALRSVISLL